MEQPSQNMVDHAETRLNQLYTELMADCTVFLQQNSLLEIVSGVTLSVKFRPEYHDALGEEETAMVFMPEITETPRYEDADKDE